mgnify:CR=1 FL=1
MRAVGAIRAKWSGDGDELLELDLGPEPSEELDDRAKDAIDAKRERRDDAELARKRMMMLAAVPGVKRHGQTEK